MEQKEIVLKPTGTVQIVNKFSLVERKLLNGIIWHSQKTRFEQAEHILPIREVFQIIGLTASQNYEVIKDAVRTLTSTIIEWNTFGDDKTLEWGVCTFLASGKIVAGRLKYRLNPELVEKIKSPTLFAKIQLLIQSQFKRRHALVLYEFLVDSLCRRRSNRLVIDQVPLDKLYALLGMNDTKLIDEGNFKFFNRDVLKPSLKEINDCSDIHVECSAVRKQRKVIALSFVIELKTPLPQAFLEDIEHPENIIGAVMDDTHSQGRADELIDQLIALGVERDNAIELIGQYPAERIEANLQLVIKLREKGKSIKNLPGYLISAIEKDYQANLHKTEGDQANKDAVNKQRDALSSKQEREWRKFVSARLKEKYDKQDDEWKRRRQAMFLKRIQTENNVALLAAFRKSGFENRLLQKCILSEVRQELLTEPEELSLQDYLAWTSKH